MGQHISEILVLIASVQKSHLNVHADVSSEARQLKFDLRGYRSKVLKILWASAILGAKTLVSLGICAGFSQPMLLTIMMSTKLVKPV